MYDSILVPTDGGEDMSAVAEQAIDLASLCDATVHVLHVVDDRAYLTVPEDARDQVRVTLEEDGDAFTGAIAERATEVGLAVEREVRWGDPAPTILSYAVDEDLDVIVMGTHGRTGFERYLLGSVAEKVVRVSPVPVLTIALGDTDERRADIREAAATPPGTGRNEGDGEGRSGDEHERDEPSST